MKKKLIGRSEQQYRKLKTVKHSFDAGNGVRKTTEIKIIPNPSGIKMRPMLNVIKKSEIRKNPRKYTTLI